MSLLTNMPHVCTIGRQKRVADTMIGNKYSIVIEQTDVPCWEQKVSAKEIMEYEKRGIDVTTKVYFAENPRLTEQHRILITSRQGIAESNLDITDVGNPNTLDVTAVINPDASAGLGALYRVMCTGNTGDAD